MALNALRRRTRWRTAAKAKMEKLSTPSKRIASMMSGHSLGGMVTLFCKLGRFRDFVGSDTRAIRAEGTDACELDL